MICKKCNTDFDIDQYGTKCPNCSADNPLQSFDNATNATKYVIDLYGKEILKNGKKFFGLIFRYFIIETTVFNPCLHQFITLKFTI